jgi:hypothetical protein
MRQIGRQSSHTSEADRSRDLYAFLLERFYLAAMKYADDYTTFLDYSEFGIETVSELVGRTLHRTVDTSMRQAISRSLQSYSKAVSHKPFVPKQSTGGSCGYPDLDLIYERYRDFIKEFGSRRAESQVSLAR